MGKIWDFEGNGKSYVADVVSLLKQYRDGLNSQQDLIEASIDIGMDYDSRAVLNFKVGYANLFKITVGHDGFVDLEILTSNKKENFHLSIEGLEIKLDSVIKSKEMGSVISNLIRVEKYKKGI